MSLLHAIAVVGVSVAVGIASEYIGAAITRRAPGFAASSERIARLKASVEELRQKPAGGAKAARVARNIAALEEDITAESRNLAGAQMKSTMVLALLNIGLFWLLSSWLEGIALLRLPFTPFSFLTGITHRGLAGDDMTQASFVFVFALTSTALRPVITKLFGNESAAGASSLMGGANNPLAAAFGLSPPS